MIRLHGLLRLSSLFVAMAAASAAHALGVGEVSLNSRLNQPLDAKIALFEAAGLDSDEVIVKLASPEAFERVGLDRPYFLTDLKFSPKLQGTQGNIIVTSSKPVREPYLSFLIEVIWPNGRMLREYTLLLDPPIYASSQQATASTPAQTPPQPSERPAVAATTAPPAQPQQPRATQPQQPPVQPAQPTRPATAEAAQTTSSAISPGGQYQTQSNDTLWEIANNFSPPGSNVHQAMLAIQDLNPKAFIDSNINLLKKGQVLRLPDEQQIKSRTAAAALKEVAQQNNAWRESRGLAAEQRQINATRREASNAPSQAEASDSLRLVAATQQGSTSALNERLAAAQENLDSSRRENEELKSRMSDLEGQLEKLQRLVELKDASLAKLQAQLEQANVAENMATTPVNDVSTQENYPFSTAYESNDSIAEDTIDEQEAVTIPQPTQTTLETTSSAQEERQWWERLLEDNSILLWGGGGALLLALFLVAVRSRSNARKWAERELEADNFDDEETAFVDLSGLDSSDTTFDKPLVKAAATEPAQNTKAPVQPVLAQEALPDDFVSFEPVAPPAASSNKPNPDQELDIALNDFADFDLQFGDSPLPADNSDKPTLDLTAELAAPSMPPSLNKDDNELGFVLDDNFDDFTPSSDNEPFVETTNDAPLAQETLDDLDFAELSHITEPPVVAKSEQPKPRQAAEFKAVDDDFDFLSGTDETETKLDLARAYIDMGDMEGARDILDEVMVEGSDSQKTEAQELMTSLA